MLLAEIRGTYAGLVNGHVRVNVEFFDYTVHQLGAGFIAVCREGGVLTNGDERIELLIRTSRTFHRMGATDSSITTAPSTIPTC